MYAQTAHDNKNDVYVQVQAAVRRSEEEEDS
jgi:hypothetical protein